jgi:16S rRNA (cytidine1402-2'-O)-methyltransferase
MLHVVAMPIGDPSDLPPRALKVLAKADVIACEDTRRLAPLLAANAIRTPAVSYFEHNEERRAPELVERMRGGAHVALVTDAGTPAVSDPGFRLVREALEAGIRVGAIPGPSAVTAALSISGLPTDRFTFEGFLPAKPASRQKDLKALAREHRTMVFFETARRLDSTLSDMASAFGADREAAVVREIGKTYEEVIRGKLGELAARFAESPARGEITLVIAGAGRADDRRGEGTGADPAAAPTLSVEILCEAGLSLKQASAVMARILGRRRRDIYQDALASRKSGRTDPYRDS